MNETSRRLAYHAAIDGYLDQLSELCGQTITKECLGDLHEVEKVRNKLKMLSGMRINRIELGVQNLKSDRFHSFIDKLGESKSIPIYIWLNSTNVCGAVKLPNVRDLNLGFDISKIPDGVVVLIAEDCTNKILIDFDAEDMEIEVQGEEWSSVDY